MYRLALSLAPRQTLHSTAPRLFSGMGVGKTAHRQAASASSPAEAQRRIRILLVIETRMVSAAEALRKFSIHFGNRTNEVC